MVACILSFLSTLMVMYIVNWTAYPLAASPARKQHSSRDISNLTPHEKVYQITIRNTSIPNQKCRLVLQLIYNHEPFPYETALSRQASASRTVFIPVEAVGLSRQPV